ncbi:calmodulin-A-like [Diorhabda carinulata]|uniref:calmodulin-A-like n=1 Tax=Diorhabda sublineata TaxID=1163346 RepID=UPI0024E1497E|nr:calmodulin-A-like [Diorhabda sublineata]XP_057656257.1 calmodulin-A-like [Diorhabda carinulata]
MADDDEDNELSDDQIQEFQEAFDLFDRDNDGTITLKEFCTIMRAFAQKQYEIELEEMFKEADPENNGTISFVQFLRIMETNFQEDKTSEGISEAFRAFDSLKKGIIPADDLREYMMTYGDKLTEEEANQFVKMADSNKDGKIIYEFFVSKMASVLDKQPKREPRFKEETKKSKSKSKKK